jgi:hypothetical protein
MIALYGIAVDSMRRKNPSLYNALWLFRYRAMDRHAYETKRGIEAVMKPAIGQRMDAWWFSHVTETKDQAEYAQDMGG